MRYTSYLWVEAEVVVPTDSGVQWLPLQGAQRARGWREEQPPHAWLCSRHHRGQQGRPPQAVQPHTADATRGEDTLHPVDMGGRWALATRLVCAL